MNYREQGGTELQVRRESARRLLWITLRGRPLHWTGERGEPTSLWLTLQGADAEALLREMVMIAEKWGVTADAEASR